MQAGEGKLQHRRMEIFNQTQRTVLCQRASAADTTLTRLVGLLGRPGLQMEEGLLIRPSSGVHTFGMCFAIDVVSLGCGDYVLGVWRSVGPWRICGLSFKTRSVLELTPGAIDRSSTKVGDKLEITWINS
jgi:uncharacterized membrane protein (UPF0127 family)